MVKRGRQLQSVNEVKGEEDGRGWFGGSQRRLWLRVWISFQKGMLIMKGKIDIQHSKLTRDDSENLAKVRKTRYLLSLLSCAKTLRPGSCPSLYMLKSFFHLILVHVNLFVA